MFKVRPYRDPGDDTWVVTQPDTPVPHSVRTRPLPLCLCVSRLSEEPRTPLRDRDLREFFTGHWKVWCLPCSGDSRSHGNRTRRDMDVQLYLGPRLETKT